MTNQVAIAVGLGGGIVFGLVAGASGNSTLLRSAELVAPLGTAFVQLVRMVVIPLVATTVFSGVAALGDPRRLGRVGGITLLFFWITSFIAIAIGIVAMKVALWIAPIATQQVTDTPAPQELPGVVDFFLGLIPSNPFEVAANGALLPLIVFMVLFAAAAGAIPDDQRASLMALADAVTAALVKLVHWILWTAPVGVFALAAPLTAAAGWELLKSLAVFIAAVAIGLAVFVGGVYMPAGVLLARIPGGRFIRGCLGPVAIGAGATSSAAALPAMFESAQEQLGVSQAVAGLVLSLGTAINRAGSALFQGAAIVFLAALYGVPLPMSVIGAVFIATFLVSLTVAAVPSASVVTLAPALDVAGVPLAGMAILFGIDRIPDVLRSGTNVMGHVTASVVTERLANQRQI